MVEPGTYVENINFLGKMITVKSVGGAEVTIIDGSEPVDPDEGSVVMFTGGEGMNTVLDGFTIRNGTGVADFYSSYGGGIYCNASSPTIIRNIIVGNEPEGNTSYGGGICSIASSAVIKFNTIRNNHGSRGGGIYFYGASGSEVSDNLIRDNSAVRGGGIFCERRNCNPNIVNNIIQDNTTAGDAEGGGIQCESNSAPIITDNIIAGNRTDGTFVSSGAGIRCYESSPEITDNIIAGNSALGASGKGGGIAIQFSAPVIYDNLLVMNEAVWEGGGVYCWEASPVLINNTFSGNYSGIGGAMRYEIDSYPVVVNSIMWDDSSESGDELSGDDSITITFSAIEGGWVGEGNIDEDPLFVDPDSNDFGLQAESPCIDTGHPLIKNVPWGGWRRDMGANEYDQGFFFDGQNLIKKPFVM